MAQTLTIASCQCGRVSIPITGEPILHAMCYCEGCRTAGTELDQETAAPPIVSPDGGTDVVLYRKDRIGPITGLELLREHRLTPDAPTRRMVASCCASPMFLEFMAGHWISVYRARLSGTVPPLEMRVMTRGRPVGPAMPTDVPAFREFPFRFLFRLGTAFAGMGFRKPAVPW